MPADKAPNNIIIICKRYYIEVLIKELGLDNCSTPTGHSTYTLCQMSSEDIVNTHNTMLLLTNCEAHTGKYSDCSFEVQTERSEVHTKN